MLNDIFFFFENSRLKRMEAVAQICDAHLTGDFKLGDNFTDESIFDIIQDVAPSFNDTMFYCKWRNENNFCQAFFQPILTEEGVCYTFNILNSRDIYTKEFVLMLMLIHFHLNG